MITTMCPLLPVLLLHLALLTAGGDQEGGVCSRDQCDEELEVRA